MLKEERQHIILEEIANNNKVHSNTLSKKLNVSEDTIRRDLKELSEIGHIKKVHGGAMANPTVPEAITSQKISDQREHLVIAQKASGILESHKVIVMEGDESNLILAGILPPDFSATVFTNSLKVATRLFEYPNIETFMLGGKISRRSPVTSGLEVMDALADIHADICLLEASSLHHDIGMTDGDRERAQIKKKIISHSSNVITMCLSRRVGSIKPFKVDGLERITTLITELDEDDAQLGTFVNKGIKIV
ncbi:MAG: DeoR/GlpR family DNA-binding transcription regulator [Reichenbachiella sp.]|uniref:DeoR/GlpR family DNA-binding transcription regulator n=1 Tax=Reichenbachiella sp. TaxID=2184521 RepID=UPI00329A3C6F